MKLVKLPDESSLDSSCLSPFLHSVCFQPNPLPVGTGLKGMANFKRFRKQFKNALNFNEILLSAWFPGPALSGQERLFVVALKVVI